MRKCLVSRGKNETPYNAMFHQWSFESQILEPSIQVGGHPGGQVCGTFGIVEYDNGNVELVHPSRIKFTEWSE